MSEKPLCVLNKYNSTDDCSTHIQLWLRWKTNWKIYRVAFLEGTFVLTSRTLIFDLAEDSKKAQWFHCLARFWPCSFPTTRSSSRSHLFPTRIIGTWGQVRASRFCLCPHDLSPIVWSHIPCSCIFKISFNVKLNILFTKTVQIPLNPFVLTT